MTTQHQTTETETEKKTEALAAYLDVEDAEDIEYCGDMLFETGGKEYLVCTDEEATEYAAEYIKESLWAFNPGFIIEHSKLPYAAEEMISSFCGEACEDANATIKALIIDIDEFVDEAISTDGRGHFMNSYDGRESEHNGLYIYRMG